MGRGALIRTALALAGVVVLGLAPGRAPAATLGDPPGRCAELEWLRNPSCIVQTRYLALSLSPRAVKAGGVVELTATVMIGAQIPGRPQLVVSTSLQAIGIGPAVGPCPPITTPTSLVRRCRFRATTPTRGWRTYQLPVGTSQGPAFSRVSLAVLGPEDRDREVLQGTVRAGSRGVGGVPVTYRGPSGGVARTGEDGGYAVVVEKGRYTVSAPRGDCWTRFPRVGAFRVCAPASVQAPGRADFEWPVGRLGGTVFARSSGTLTGRRGLGGVEVVATGYGPAAGQEGRTRTAGGGRYEIEVPEGPYVVSLVDRTGNPRAARVEVGRISTAGVDFEVCGGPDGSPGACFADVEVTVRDLTGAPLDRAYLRAVRFASPGLFEYPNRRYIAFGGAATMRLEDDPAWAVVLDGIQAQTRPGEVDPEAGDRPVEIEPRRTPDRVRQVEYEITSCVGGTGAIAGDPDRPACRFAVDVATGKPSPPRIDVLARLVRVTGTVRRARLPVRVAARNRAGREVALGGPDTASDSGRFELLIPERLADGVGIIGFDAVGRADERAGRIASCPGGRIRGERECVLSLGRACPRGGPVVIDFARGRPRR